MWMHVVGVRFDDQADRSEHENKLNYPEVVHALARQLVPHLYDSIFVFFFQAEDGIRDIGVTGVHTCALPIYSRSRSDQPWLGWSCAMAWVTRTPPAPAASNTIASRRIGARRAKVLIRVTETNHALRSAGWADRKSVV